MNAVYSKAREALRSAPLLLPKIPKSNEIVDKMLSFDTGIEIECTFSQQFKSESGETYAAISSFERKMLKEANVKVVNSDPTEQRFRIPKGVQGAISLYKALEIIKETCAINPKSGIHYHIDFTKYYPHLFSDKSLEDIISENKKTILKSLEHWGYNGNYNTWDVTSLKTAVKFHHDYKTIEFRIGEMSFDYELVMKRILNCQNIVKAIIKRSSLKSLR